MSVVISSGMRQTVIIASGACAIATAVGIGWERIKKFRPIKGLVDLSLSGGLFSGVTSTGTLVGAMAGSTFALGGTPPAGLSIPSTGGIYHWSGSGSGSGIYTITETNAGASGSPHVTTVHWAISSGGGGSSSPGLLREDGSFLLREDGSEILLETVTGSTLLREDGSHLLREDGADILLETTLSSLLLREDGSDQLREDGSHILLEA